MKRAYGILILMILTTSNVFAQTSGNCGKRSGSGTTDDPYVYANNCTYEYDATTKTLTISGTGSIADFTYKNDEESDTPWRGLGYENVTIGEGITRVGSFAFNNSNLKNISLPDTLKSIGSYTFAHTGLSAINIPSSATSIGQGAFSDSAITSIILPEGIKNIEYRMLQAYNLQEVVIPASVTSIDVKAFSYNDNLVNQPKLTKIYCSAEQMAQCEAAVAYRGDHIKIEEYQTEQNGTYFFNGQWYNSPNDIIGDNHIKKRIYTIDEANKVTGKVNTVKIRYK